MNLALNRSFENDVTMVTVPACAAPYKEVAATSVVSAFRARGCGACRVSVRHWCGGDHSGAVVGLPIRIDDHADHPAG